ncbi:MAG: elongation factor P maturation arginine rhamnosyltransferase EarP [Casimicrobiaceae bacterium]
MRWDIFCKVVDNFGDIGVCWRLSRQLATERGFAVRLWVDDVAALARIWPGIDPEAAAQSAAGVDIRHWSDGTRFADLLPGDVVIEAFGCDVPAQFVDSMTKRRPQPAWFNLEYLSAENWVESHHLLPSPHPRVPLVKHFYYPGFTRRTGGLLREARLFDTRDAFLGDRDAIAAWWQANGVTDMSADASTERPAGKHRRQHRELRISMFAYANPAAPVLFDAWSQGKRLITCVVPEGVLNDEIATFLGVGIPAGRTVIRRNLRIVRVPFMKQTEYDRLLWIADFNFVRGEDSFVRAQWAARPFVWNIYPQAGNAHAPKLAAFVARYGASLGDGLRPHVASLFNAWNGRGDMGMAWVAVEPHLREWTSGASTWSTKLASQRDLASELAENAENRL